MTIILDVHVFQQELISRSHLPANRSPHVPETWCCYSMVRDTRSFPVVLITSPTTLNDQSLFVDLDS